MAAAVTKYALAALSAFLDDGTLLCIMNDKCMEKKVFHPKIIMMEQKCIHAQ